MDAAALRRDAGSQAHLSPLRSQRPACRTRSADPAPRTVVADLCQYIVSTCARHDDRNTTLDTKKRSTQKSSRDIRSDPSFGIRHLHNVLMISFMQRGGPRSPL